MIAGSQQSLALDLRVARSRGNCLSHVIVDLVHAKKNLGEHAQSQLGRIVRDIEKN
jgi:hypothetical protein